jgi:probable DNA repair protein
MNLPSRAEPDTLVLTAGSRLARHLHDEHARAQIASGRRAWPTPAIHALPVWLERLWAEGLPMNGGREHLLTEAQALLIWESIVRESSVGETLLLPAAAAREAAEAWALANAWRLPWQAASEPVNEDGELFRRWARRFERQCADNAWLDPARLMDRLRETVASGAATLPARIRLGGFDELTPQQREFFDALGGAGCVIETLAPAQHAERAVRLEVENAEDEMRAAVSWARARLSANPGSRIGIVVPDLSARRAALERLLEDALIPSAALPGDNEHARPYNFSLGPPLAGYPQVAAALRIIGLGVAHSSERRLALESVSALLRSPFLAGAESERTRRALLDAQLRKAREPFVSLGWLRLRATDRNEDGAPARHACPVLASGLHEWQQLLDQLPRAQSPARWAAAFADMLRTLGWPGERALASREHQIVEAWRELLGGFAALETVAPKLSHEDALRTVTRLAEDRPYQPRTPAAPVQVLGVLEASGLDFDHLWIMGLHDETWPAPARPNPLLPLRLQQRLGLPHASPERELQFAQQLTERLLVSGDEVVASHPRMQDDRVLRPSPLIAGLPGADRTVLAPPFISHRDLIHGAKALAQIGDARAPAFAPGPVGGGTGVIARQSDCPFRAFAEHRLGATTPDSPQQGLDASERGQLVHWVLEALWKELGTHERLVALDDRRRREHVARAVEQAVARLARRRPFTLGARLAALERERLMTLLTEWLAVEAVRAPFRVTGYETERRLDVAGLQIEARMDRVDALDDGSLVVVDYKTGETRVGDWFGERPCAPQLPLYAVYGAGGDAMAVAYARVKHGAHGFIGLEEHKGVLPGAAVWREHELTRDYESWEGLLAAWRGTLERLAREFRDGDARVAPRDDDVCRTCALKPLCRIHDLQDRVGHLVLENGGD